MASPGRYFEDFTVGLRFRSAGAVAMTAERIKSFAAEFDPQPSHLDEGARAGPCSAAWSRVAGIPPRWPCGSSSTAISAFPVKARASRSSRCDGCGRFAPATALRVEGTVTETRPSRSQADRGVVKFRTLVYNQRDEVVLDGAHVVMVRAPRERRELSGAG